MADRAKHKFLNYLIAGTWIANGLFCKVFNLVPRHQQIVAGILGDDHARTITFLIGFLETGMGIWILIGIMPRLNVAIQILVIATMNILEFALVPHLLLWGKANSIFALMFLLLIYYNGFILNKKLVEQA